MGGRQRRKRDIEAERGRVRASRLQLENRIKKARDTGGVAGPSGLRTRGCREASVAGKLKGEEAPSKSGGKLADEAGTPPQFPHRTQKMHTIPSGSFIDV